MLIYPKENHFGYTANIEYDNSIFEGMTVEGINDWNASFNNNMILGDTSKAKANTDIAKITLKIKKENISNKKNTTIRLKNILLTDGDFEITADKQITINFTNENASKTQKINNIKDVTVIQGENTVDATTTVSNQVNKLPNAGMKKSIIIAICVLAILVIIFKIKSRKIKY